MPKPSTIREKLIAAGVRNLKEFGYPDVTPENILTDFIYSRFFDSMLEEHAHAHIVDAREVAALRKEIKPDSTTKG